MNDEDTSAVTSTSVNRNILLSVLHYYIRRSLLDLPEWVRENSDEVRSIISVSKPTMKKMLHSGLALDPYSPRVEFAWCTKRLQIFARVKHGLEWEPDGADLREAKKVRYRLNRNVLRSTAALFLQEKLPELPTWLREHPRAVAGWIKRDPSEVEALSVSDVSVAMHSHGIVIRWNERTIEVNILVHNEISTD